MNNYPFYYYPAPIPMPVYPIIPYTDMRQQVNAQQILQRLRSQHSNLYSQLQQAGMNRQIADYVFFFIVNYTLNQANQNQSAAQIYQ